VISLKIEFARLPEHAAPQQVHAFIGRRRLGGCYLQGEDEKK
jgi:hypothetical protein